MKVHFQEPFIALLINNKLDAAYWRSKSGSPSYGGIQDDAVIALRKMGYNGTISDMLRQYYQDLTGNSSLMDAWAAANSLSDATTQIDFVGKAKGDGDNSRLIYYGSGSSFMHPDGFPAEANGAYAGAAQVGVGVAYYETGVSGRRAQFAFHFDLSVHGTKDELFRLIKSLEIYAPVKNTSVHIFNDRTQAWVQVGIGTGDVLEPITFELNGGNLNDYISNDGKFKVGFISNAASDGVAAARVEVDYFKATLTLLK